MNRSPLEPGAALMAGVGVAAAMSAVLLLPITYLLFGDGIDIGAAHYGCGSLYFATLVGLAMTGIVVLITNYYTSTAYSPVRKIAKASETGHATNIIAGLATGQHATALPVIFIAMAILISYHCGNLYGIAIAVMSMLSWRGLSFRSMLLVR